MIALWMLYATVVGLLLAAAAQALEQVAASRGWPRRWVWLAAIFALPLAPFVTAKLRPAPQFVAGSASVPVGTTQPGRPNTSPSGTGGGAAAPTAPPPLDRIGESIAAAWDALDVAAVPAAAVRAAETRLPILARLDRWLTSTWGTISLLLLAGYVAAAVRLGRERRRWPPARIDGESVLVSADAGPAVVGTLRPTIVLPAWSLGIDARLRALILTHEREHLRARDPLLLQLVTVAAYLLPWNLPVWWMLRRLRVAVEVDCDRRVLRAGFDPRQYADLLLAVGGRHVSGGRVLVPALVERQSLLARRIVAMCPDRSKFRLLRLTCATALASLLIAAAYATPMPSATKSKLELTLDLESMPPIIRLRAADLGGVRTPRSAAMAAGQVSIAESTTQRDEHAGLTPGTLVISTPVRPIIAQHTDSIAVVGPTSASAAAIEQVLSLVVRNGEASVRMGARSRTNSMTVQFENSLHTMLPVTPAVSADSMHGATPPTAHPVLAFDAVAGLSILQVPLRFLIGTGHYETPNQAVVIGRDTTTTHVVIETNGRGFVRNKTIHLTSAP